MLVNNRREVVANVQRARLKPVDRTNHGQGCHDLNSLAIHLPTKHTKDTKISEAEIAGFMSPWQQTLVFHSQTFFILTHPRKHFLQKATKKTKTAICSRNLRYLRFLLLMLIRIFAPTCDRDIATFAVALRETEFVGIPTRFPDTRDKSVRGNRSLCPYRLQSRHR